MFTGLHGLRRPARAAAVLCGVLVVGCASPTPSTFPAASADSPTPRWTLLAPEAWPPAAELAAITARTSGGFLAAAASNGEVTILASADGRSWSPLADESGALRRSNATRMVVVSGLAQHGETIVAVGADALDDASAGDARAWASPDGSHWEIAELGGDGRDATMTAVAAGASGFVAVGSDGYPGASVQLSGSRGAAAWVSTDGRQWTRAPAQPSFDGAIMESVISFDGGYVAWGESIPSNLVAGRPAVWASKDGLTWSRSPVEDAQPAQMMPVRAVAAANGALVAVGVLPDPAHDDAAMPAAWTSMDGGATWRRATVIVPRPGVPVLLRSLAFDGSMLLAIGKEDMPGGYTARIAAWRSSDLGTTWNRLPDDPALANAFADTMIPVPGGFAVFGQADEPDALVQRNLEWIASR